MINLLCIRDPDSANGYVSDGPINEITIDIGGSWPSYNRFASDLAEGEPEAEGYAASVIEQVADLPEDNPVRLAVEGYFAQAREDGR